MAMFKRILEGDTTGLAASISGLLISALGVIITVFIGIGKASAIGGICGLCLMIGGIALTIITMVTHLKT
jgi:hypothetical protein